MMDTANQLAAENERLKQLEQPGLLNAAQGVLDAWEQSKSETHPRSAMAVMRIAVGALYGAVMDAKQSANPDSEAWLETLVQEIAYQRVKESYLFNQLGREVAERKADELAVRISLLIETWIVDEVTRAS
jgi:hypothetical protein